MISNVIPALQEADVNAQSCGSHPQSMFCPVAESWPKEWDDKNEVREHTPASALPTEVSEWDRELLAANERLATPQEAHSRDGVPTSKQERLKISWKCGLCGYHVLAMDHVGNPLPLSLSSFGELLPMSCPCCMLEHTKWEQEVPFNEHGDHANIPSRLSNNYVYTTHPGESNAKKSLTSNSLPESAQGSGVVFPPVKQDIGGQKHADGVGKASIHMKARSRLPRLAYYCSNCDRELLRMDPYGELIPMLCDKDGTPLPVVCPGCKLEHNKWDVRPLKVTRGRSPCSMDSNAVLALLPGAAQGAVVVALGHPFDTVKTRMQALGPGASRSLLHTLWTMARTEGVRRLYSGISPPLVMSATKRSLQFALWDTFRSLDNQSAMSPPTSSRCRSLSSQASGWIGASPFRAGAFAGGVGTIIGCPMHVIKIRTQFLTRNTTRNAWTCALKIFQTEGPKGFYCGFRYHLVKDALFAGCYLGLYDVNKRWLCHLSEVSASSYWRAHMVATMGSPPDFFTGQMAFLAGSTSSMATWLLLYPLDTVKTIVQARNIGFGQAVDIVRKEASLLYRGLGASLVRAGPVCGVAMVVYELVKSKTDRLLLQQRHAHRRGSGVFNPN